MRKKFDSRVENLIGNIYLLLNCVLQSGVNKTFHLWKSGKKLIKLQKKCKEKGYDFYDICMRHFCMKERKVQRLMRFAGKIDLSSWPWLALLGIDRLLSLLTIAGDNEGICKLLQEEGIISVSKTKQGVLKYFEDSQGFNPKEFESDLAKYFGIDVTIEELKNDVDDLIDELKTKKMENDLEDSEKETDCISNDVDEIDSDLSGNAQGRGKCRTQTNGESEEKISGPSYNRAKCINTALKALLAETEKKGGSKWLIVRNYLDMESVNKVKNWIDSFVDSDMD